jgi:glucoamylase
VLQRVRFVPHSGTLADYNVYVLLAPHLANWGNGNTAWVDQYKEMPMVCAERDGYALALACSAPWAARSVGVVGVSDGWQQLHADKYLTHTYVRAENGNVALTGQIDIRASEGVFVLALGFGPTSNEAGQHARISLLEDFDTTKAAYVHGWKQWHRSLQRRSSWTAPRRRFYDLSVAVLRAHEDKRIEGGVIASLSVPWGF